jgi:glutamate-1-semialdehyde 2,1-aminomutase
MSMTSGLAAMDLLDESCFGRLDAVGEAARDGFRKCLRDEGLPGSITGAGSLLKIHVVDRDITDYRSAYPTADEARLMAALHQNLPNCGVLAAGNGLLALSSPIQQADIDAIVQAFAQSVRGLMPPG